MSVKINMVEGDAEVGQSEGKHGGCGNWSVKVESP